MKSIAAPLLIAFAAATNLQDARLPIPDPGAQKEAEKLVHDVFQAEYALKSAQDRQALAAKLLQQAVQAGDDRTLRYVLLADARDLGAEGGDLETAWSAVKILEREYAVDGLKEK